jgi:hypothetical protein
MSFLVWALFVTWFSFEGTRFITFFGFLWGTIVTIIISFIIFKFSSTQLSRFLVETNIGKGAAFASGWMNSAAISSCMISIVFFFYLLFVPISRFFFVNKYENEDQIIINETKKDVMNYFGNGNEVSEDKFFYGILSYGIAILTSGIFLRDVPKTLGLGLVLGNELTGKINS